MGNTHFDLMQVTLFNDNDALIPEIWVAEALRTLQPNMVAANMVMRDLSTAVAQMGDIAHVHKVANMTASRKVDGEDVATNSADSLDIRVPLDQHITSSFMIYDAEASKSMGNLIATHLVPAVASMARQLDLLVLGERFNFFGQQAGNISGDISIDEVIDLGALCDELLWPVDGRQAIVSPRTKAKLLKIDDFRQADKMGDAGTRMRTASIGGGIMGFDWYMDQHCKQIASTGTGVASTTTTADAEKGDTVIAVASATGLAAGQLTQVGGAVYRIVSIATLDVTLDRGLDADVASGGAVVSYSLAAVTADYAADFHKQVGYDGVTGCFDQPGYGLLADPTGAGRQWYGTLESDGTAGEFLPNRPLGAALANDTELARLVNGSYNWAFLPDAVALVSRPLQAPESGSGVRAFQASYNGIGIRATIAYDALKQGHRVTLDMLAGVKTVDSGKGVLFLDK